MEIQLVMENWRKDSGNMDDFLNKMKKTLTGNSILIDLMDYRYDDIFNFTMLEYCIHCGQNVGWILTQITKFFFQQSNGINVRCH